MKIKRKHFNLAVVAFGVVAVVGTYCLAQGDSIDALLPDLKVHSVSAPGSASQGASISVSDVTTNAGTASAGQSWSSIYITTNLNDISATWLVTNHNVAAIAKGKSSTWSGNVTVPASQPLGGNYYVVVCNPNHQVGESNYNNNTNSVAITINP